MRKQDIKIGDEVILTGELEGIIGKVKLIDTFHIHLLVGRYWVKAHHSMLRPIKKEARGGLEPP